MRVAREASCAPDWRPVRAVPRLAAVEIPPCMRCIVAAVTAPSWVVAAVAAAVLVVTLASWVEVPPMAALDLARAATIFSPSPSMEAMTLSKASASGPRSPPIGISKPSMVYFSGSGVRWAARMRAKRVARLAVSGSPGRSLAHCMVAPAATLAAWRYWRARSMGVCQRR